MRNLNRAISIALFLAMIGLGQAVGLAQSQSRMNEQQMRALLLRLVQRSDIFSARLEAGLNRTPVSGQDSVDQIRQNSHDLAQAITGFRDVWEGGRATSADARKVLDQAGRVNRAMGRNHLGIQAENSWSDERFELDQLAAAYDLNWQWNDGGNGVGSGNSGGVSSSNDPIGGVTGSPRQDNQGVANRHDALTGTYTLDVSRSDDPRTAAQRAVQGSSTGDRQHALDDLTARMEAADRLAIDRRGQSVTIESSRAPQVTVVADGSVHTEQDQNGKTVRVRSNLNGDRLTISSTGAAASSHADDYEVTFEPFNNGRSLRVTRKITSEYTSQPVTVQSVYDKTSDVAQLNPNVTSPSVNSGPVQDGFVIPDNVVLMGVLNTDLSTKTARENDRFNMTIRTPSQYEGAIIEGHITGVQRSGRSTGRSGMTLNFDTIRLTDGTTYRFSGLVESVRTQGGDEVKVNNEGNVQTGDSRGETTAKRAAVGTVAGAIIGAIAGGGKGAAIGATVGAGAGAGSVYAQGTDDLDLNNGTEIRVRTSTPRDYSESR